MHKGVLILLTILQSFSYINGSDNNNEAKKVVCYYGGLSNIPEISELLPEDIDANVCTHIVFLQGDIDTELEEVTLHPIFESFQTGGSGYAERMVNLKENNPELKLILFISPEHIPWVLETPERKAKIIKSAVLTLNATGFDGLDFSPYDVKDLDALATFFCEMKAEFDKYGFTVSTIATKNLESNTLDTVMEKVSRCCSFVSLLMIDAWTETINATRLLSPINQTMSMVEKYIEKGYPENKLLLSVPTFGLIVTLLDPKETGLGASVKGRGVNGTEYSDGYSLFNGQLMKKLNDTKEGWTIVRDEQSNFPYAYSKTGKWVSFEDTPSAVAKASYVLEKKLGGVQIFTLDMEDFDGTTGTSFPIIRSISDTFKQSVQNINTNS